MTAKGNTHTVTTGTDMDIGNERKKRKYQKFSSFGIAELGSQD